MRKIKVFVLSLIFSLFIFSLSADPKISLISKQGNTLKDTFDVGTTFEVEVKLEGNDGTYGVFFDLNYDNDVFELVDILQGSLLPPEENKKELLIARGAYNLNGKVIVSNSLVGEEDMFYTDGTIVKLVFKALQGAENQSIFLDPANTGIYYKDQGNLLKKSVIIQNLSNLTVIGPYSYFFVQFISPYNNYKTNVSKIDYNILATVQDPNFTDQFKIGLKKVKEFGVDAEISDETEEIFLYATDGYAFFSADMNDMFSLTPGFNNIVATLYVNNNEKAFALRRVYYEVLDRGIKITDPINNTITGKSSIVITGYSTFKDVSINNVTDNDLLTVNEVNSEKYSFVYNGFKLKEGFNKITARAINPEAVDVPYTDTIVVYYQRDESIFDFIAPLENSVFKNNESGTIINIKGVIDTTDTDLITVKMRVKFKPFDTTKNDYDYAFIDTDSENKEIVLRDLDNTENFLLSNYVFESSFNLNNIKGYGSGILTFYAVKIDKTGTNKDIEISRSVIIDSQKLTIDLRQPNLFSHEAISSKSALVDKYLVPGSDNTVDISECASISIKKKNELYKSLQTSFNGMTINNITVTSDGASYVVVNDSTSRIDIYKKTIDSDFANATKRSYYTAYANCAVEFGNNSLLVGISDYNKGENHPSGLIILNNGLIRTAKLPPELNHIQYIERIGSDYYLYASTYKYLYKFNEADVIISQYDSQFFEIRNIKKYYMPNTMFINEMKITGSGKTVLLGTEKGVLVYKYSDLTDSYSQVSKFKTDYNIVKLEKAEFSSKYKVYLFAYKQKEEGTENYIVKLSTITEYNGNFTEKSYDSLIYKDVYNIHHLENNKFVVYGKDQSNNISLKEFDVFYGINEETNYTMPVLTDTEIAGKIKLFFFDKNNYYLYGTGLLVVSEIYENQGSLELLIQKDLFIDGIRGFSYEAPSVYSDLLEVDYCFSDSIEALDNPDNYLRFDAAGIPVADKKVSKYEYKENDGYDYLKLKIRIKSTDNNLTSTFINNISILKKENVHTISSSLELRGFITDKTVDKNGFTINSSPVPLEENGYFSHVINLDTEDENKLTPVRLYAINAVGETDELFFNIMYVTNKPELTAIKMNYLNSSSQNIEQSVTTYEMDATNDTINSIIINNDIINLSGYFTGLYGVEVNAEQYSVEKEDNSVSLLINSYKAYFDESDDVDGILNGHFKIDNIKLVPGKQRFYLKCTNQSGMSKELKFDINFEVEDEKIVILNYKTINNILYSSNDSNVFEISKNSSGKYIKTIELTGRILTSKPVDKLCLRSDTEYITFSKGDIKDAEYIEVELREVDKLFTLYLNLKIEDNSENQNTYVKLWPNVPQLYNCSMDLYINLLKVFSDVYPDFSVTQFDTETGKIDLKFIFNETVPENMLIRFRLNTKDVNSNYTYLPFTRGAGYNGLFNYADDVYSYNYQLQAQEGTNIIDWWLLKDNGTAEVFDSSDKLLSQSGNDKILVYNYNIDQVYTEFKINSMPDNTSFYDNESLKDDLINIFYDARGSLEVKINNNNINVAQYTVNNNFIYDMTQTVNLLNQGLNNISISYIYNPKNIDLYRNSTFKYDSVSPAVKIINLSSNPDFQNPYVDSITTEITESNLKEVRLVYNRSVLSVSPEIQIFDNGVFVYKWDDLESYQILPSVSSELYVEAIDITDKTGQSEIINNLYFLYYDVTLSNDNNGIRIYDVKGNEVTDSLISRGGSIDQTTDFSSYLNEQTQPFFDHLKYEANDIKHNQRIDITETFSKEAVFDSTKKYLLFEINSQDPDLFNKFDITYKRTNKLTRKAAVTPVDFLQVEDYTYENCINSIELDGVKNGEKQIYCLVEGYKVGDANGDITYQQSSGGYITEHYIGYAKDVKVFGDYAFVVDWLDQRNNTASEEDDYRSIIVYNLLTKEIPAEEPETPPIPPEEPEPPTYTYGVPKIIKSIDNKYIQKLENIKIYDQMLFALCQNNGLLIYDISALPDIAYINNNQSAPFINPVNSETNEKMNVFDVAKSGDYLYAAVDNKIMVYSIINKVIAYRNSFNLTSDINDTAEVLYIKNNNLYAIYKDSSDIKLNRYTINGENITLIETIVLTSDISNINDPKFWDDGVSLYILPYSGAHPVKIDLNFTSGSTVTTISSLVCNNIPVEHKFGYLYPATANIYYSDTLSSTSKSDILVLDSGGDSSTGPSYGVAVADSVIYSAAGEKGLVVINGDGSKVDDLTGEIGSNGWIQKNLYLNCSTTDGIVNIPFELNSDTIAYNAGIKKTFDPGVLIDSNTKININFEMKDNSDDESLFNVLFEFKNYGKLYRNFYVEQPDDATSDVLIIYNDEVDDNLELADKNEFIDKEFTLDSLGLSDMPSDYLMSVTLSNIMVFTKKETTQTLPITDNDKLYVDSITLPDYKKFKMPLSHLAFYVEDDIDIEDNEVIKTGLFAENSENIIITKSNKVVSYFELPNSNITNVYNALHNDANLGNQLINIEYSSDYFETFSSSYANQKPVLPTNQYHDGIPVSLTSLSDYNSETYGYLFDLYFAINPVVTLGTATDDLDVTTDSISTSYGAFLTDTLIVQPPAEGDRISEKTSKFVEIERKENGTISFWLRLEDEIPWFRAYSNWNDFNTDINKSIISWGGDNSSDKNYRFTVKPNSLSFVQYKQLPGGVVPDDLNIEPGNKISKTIVNDYPPVNSFYGSWHLITLTWQKTDAGTGLTMYVDEEKVNDIPAYFNNFDINKFTHPNIVFGDIDQEVSSLYYSIASCKIFNRALTQNEIRGIYAAFNKLQGTGNKFAMMFNGNCSFTSDNPLEQVTVNSEVYETTNNGQGIALTKGMTNYISNNLSSKKLMLTDSFNYSDLIKQNVYSTDYNDTEKTITITRIDPAKQAVYHLTNGSNSGLGIIGAESYTFAGRILSTSLSDSDVCIIKINGVEKSYKLKTGDFKFTYSGVSSSLNSIDIYFVFNQNSLVFDSRYFSFNAGRYTGSRLIQTNDYPNNQVQVKHKFYNKESVVVYYKPLFENEWELNGEEIVILDSALYKIGIKNNKYYAQLKSRDGIIQLDSNVPIKGDLNQLALVYDFSSLTFKFYINSKLEASYNGNTFYMPSFIDVMPDVYNMAVGSNIDMNVKAQGIFDQFEIYPYQIDENKLQLDYFKMSKIVSFANGSIFNTKDVILNLNNNIQNDIEVKYYFDNDSTAETADLTATGSMQIAREFGVGSHTLFMDITVQNIAGMEYKKQEIYKFNVNYAPSLKLVDADSIIIKNSTCNINLKLEKDIKNQYAEMDDYISLDLFISSQSTDLLNENNKIEIIREDKVNSNKGTYILYKADNTDDGEILYTGKEIKFILNDYVISENVEELNYAIQIYYTGDGGDPVNPYYIYGKIKLLSIEGPNVIMDTVAEVGNIVHVSRPKEIAVWIKDFNPAEDNCSNIGCNYTIKKYKTDSQSESDVLETGILYFDQYGKITVNVSKYYMVGLYEAEFEPFDAKSNKAAKISNTFTIGETENSEDITVNGKAYISELDLMFVDKNTNTARINLKAGVNELGTSENYTVNAVLMYDGATSDLLLPVQVSEESYNNILVVYNVNTGMEYKVTAKVDYQGTIVEKSLIFKYQGKFVDVNIINGPKGLIGYNNIYFNWEGSIDGIADNSLTYNYQIDNSPWRDTGNNHIEFYNLEDGYHLFKVQAVFSDSTGKIYSQIRSNIFIIDTKKPVINLSKITLTEVLDSDGNVGYLKLDAQADSIADLTLSGVSVNDQSVVFNSDGSFKIDQIPLDYDGTNVFKIQAIDGVGNVETEEMTYDFNILEIEYPETISDLNNPQDNEFVKYSPLTVYGRISNKIKIDDNFKIFVNDPYGIREAKVNFDRTFFVENVKINPGTPFKSIKTVLTFTSQLANGRKIRKIYDVYAREVIKPVELELSVHAVEGGADTTEVKMVGTTDVSNVACWSFDYDGDGVFEDEYYTNEKTMTVYYKYSSVGIIHPRVRVITQDNHIFSGEDTLIIHDSIIKADIKTIYGAKSIDIIEIDDPNSDQVDGYEYVYILQKDGSNNIIKRYIIEANSAVLLDNSSVYINLNQMNINYPRSIKADSNGDIYVASLFGSGSKLYKLVKGTGGYVKSAAFNLTLESEVIASFDIDANYIYLTTETGKEILKYKKDSTFVMRQAPNMDNIIEDIGSDAGIETDGTRLWIADYKSQRIISVASDNFALRNYFGEFGSEEGQFISPKIVRVKGNYIYVMDQSEKTLQIFEKVNNDFRIICRVNYTADYLPAGFLNYVTDFTVFTKLENKLRYHYVAMTNSYTNQVALLRIPKWQVNSIKLKSNLICYIKSNEIFISKPDGADCRKLFSSGSLPGVDGNVDYPSIGPDGSTLVFVSRIEKYEYLPENNEYIFRKYDKLYLIDVDGNNCRLISHPLIDGKEIGRPQFSFNGSKIAFSAKGAGEFWTIYEYDIKTGEITKLFENTKDCLRPTYSPDDRYIAYVAKNYNHNEIFIYDREKPEQLINLTSNDFNDDYPVWAPVYEGETTVNAIKSKIAFVSNPDFTEKVFYTYIAQETSGDFRIVTSTGGNVGNDPDKARNELQLDYESIGTISYPCYTSLGNVMIFETYKEGVSKLMQYDLKDKVLSATGTPDGARRPSGMKNRIINFEAEIVNGNDMLLTWDRYAPEDLIYTVAYMSSAANTEWSEKSFISQDHALIEDLGLGLTYYVRVYVWDLLRDCEVTTTVLKKVVVYPVVARPTITIDENNPYLIKMKAWKPETDTPWQYQWKFKWYIDNYKIEETYSDTVEFEVGLTGKKRITLEALIDTDSTKSSKSDPVEIDILGNLTPYFEYEMINYNGKPAIRLDASKSSGRKIDRTNFKWRLSGANLNGNLPPEEFYGEVVTRNIENYMGNIEVTLIASSLPVTGQVENGKEEKALLKTVTLGLQEIKPVIVGTQNPDDPLLYTFDGSQSIGNIDWGTTTWQVYGPNGLMTSNPIVGVSSFTYKFPETNEDTNYTVVLNAKDKLSSLTVTYSKLVLIGSVPVVPIIDYKVITASSGDNKVSAKLLLSAASSKGNDIDWNNITWNVPLAGDYGGSSTQKGAAVVYNLYNMTEGMELDVNLTITKRQTNDIVEASEVIKIKNGEVPQIEPIIEVMEDENRDLYSTSQGDVYILSALNSKGPNIDWNNVAWLVDGQYAKQGSVVRIDVPDSAESSQQVVVTLTLKSTAGGVPVAKTMNVNVKRKVIDIVVKQSISKTEIETSTLDGAKVYTQRNAVHLSVRDSIGRNIDWERTRWFIYTGPQAIEEKYGAEIVYAFPLSSTAEYYPVGVQMYFKGSTLPFSKVFNVNIKGDKLQAVIKEEYNLEVNPDDKYVRTFTASNSVGDNIDWQNCKWTFGDSSEYQYGPVVTHKYQVDNENANYMVTLTIQRRTKEGQTEISTDTYNVSIAKDQIEAVVKVTKSGDYLVFSAEDSKGRGLLLDRSMWLFEGADSDNSGISDTDYDYNKINMVSKNFGWNLGFSTGYQVGPQWNFHQDLSGGINSSINESVTYLTDNNFTQSSGESNNNIYSGVSCRKMIDGWIKKRVTLVIYRILPDGSVEAQSKSFIYTAGQSTVAEIF